MRHPWKATALLAALAFAAPAACGGEDDDARPLSPGEDAGTAQPSADAGVPDAPATDAPTEGATWTTLRKLPNPRQENAVVALGGKVYVLGGFDDGRRIVATVERYDPSSDTWEAVAPLPETLHHLNAAVVDGKIYVVGALRGGTFTAAGVTYVYDPVGNAWTPGTAMPTGTERGSSMTAAIGGKIYVAGGLRGGVSVADFSVYDVEADAWSTLPALPVARDHGVGAAAGGLFYAIAGRNSALSGRLDVFEPEAGTWSERAPMPTPRGGFMAAVLESGRIVTCGGEGNRNAESGVFAETEGYVIAEDRWERLPDMPTPRHGTGAAAVGGVMIVPGGATVEGFGAVDGVEGVKW